MRSAELTFFNTKTTTPSAVVSFNGRWGNELGSVMTLIVNGSSVTGQYQSAVGGNGTLPPPMPLVGTVTGDLLSFTVNWTNSITAWVGHGVIDKTTGKPRILTLWQMVMAIPDETDPTNQWKTVAAGADEFDPLP